MIIVCPQIPATAVEMPGDLNSNIGYLDVQFGAMDFMSDGSTFDGVPDSKFNSTGDVSHANSTSMQNSNLDLNQSAQNAPMDSYSVANKSSTQGSITSALSQNVRHSACLHKRWLK